jgi:hypothetical protein
MKGHVLGETGKVRVAEERQGLSPAQSKRVEPCALEVYHRTQIAADQSSGL